MLHPGCQTLCTAAIFAGCDQHAANPSKPTLAEGIKLDGQEDKGGSHVADAGSVIEGGVCTADSRTSVYVWRGIKMNDGAVAQGQDTNTSLSFFGKVEDKMQFCARAGGSIQ